MSHGFVPTPSPFAVLRVGVAPDDLDDRLVVPETQQQMIVFSKRLYAPPLNLIELHVAAADEKEIAPQRPMHSSSTRERVIGAGAWQRPRGGSVARRAAQSGSTGRNATLRWAVSYRNALVL
eukprot:6200201-Pleurochrysis_carterae.AAC.2